MAAKPDEAATKQRIISHMNRDHPDSVSLRLGWMVGNSNVPQVMRYLESYSKVPYGCASYSKLVDISLSTMTIEAKGKQYTVTLDPPMNSWSEARERYVQMDKECIAALGRHPTSLNTYRPPKSPADIWMWTMCTFLFLTLPRRANWVPGSLIGNQISKFGLSGLFLRARWPTWWFMFIVHGIEAYMMSQRMRKHSVPFWSKVWWAWVASTMLEGFTSWWRLADVVADKEAAKANAKH